MFTDWWSDPINNSPSFRLGYSSVQVPTGIGKLLQYPGVHDSGKALKESFRFSFCLHPIARRLVLRINCFLFFFFLSHRWRKIKSWARSGWGARTEGTRSWSPSTQLRHRKVDPRRPEEIGSTSHRPDRPPAASRRGGRRKLGARGALYIVHSAEEKMEHVIGKSLSPQLRVPDYVAQVRHRHAFFLSVLLRTYMFNGNHENPHSHKWRMSLQVIMHNNLCSFHWRGNLCYRVLVNKFQKFSS